MSDEEEEAGSDDAAAGQMRQNGVTIHMGERSVIFYDKMRLCLFDDEYRPQQDPQQHQQQGQQPSTPQASNSASRLASLWLSKPAFVVRSLREVLEPGQLNTAWRSSREASFSCYNRSVLVGVRRLQRGDVTAVSEDVRLYASGDEAGDHLPPFVGYEGYFSEADFEQFLAGDNAGATASAAEAAAPKAAASRRQKKQKQQKKANKHETGQQ